MCGLMDSKTLTFARNVVLCVSHYGMPSSVERILRSRRILIESYSQLLQEISPQNRLQIPNIQVLLWNWKAKMEDQV